MWFLRKIDTRKKRDDNGNDMYIIDLNKEGFDMDDYRKIQLVVYFHLLKMNFQGTTFNQISGEEENIFIPYTFRLDEEMAIVTVHGMKMLYIEISDEEYIEIDFDKICIVIEDDEIREKCIEMLDLVHAYDLVPDIGYLSFTDNRTKWQRVLLNEYEFAMKIGETFIKNGHVVCYPKDGDAFIVTKQKEIIDQKSKIEYMAVRSNIYDGRTVVFLHQFQEVIMLGFFPEEVERMKGYLLTGKI